MSMTHQISGTLYPIPIDDYPKLLRYKVTEDGVHYIEDLMREIYIEGRNLSLSKLTQLGLLLKTYICQTKKIEDEALFQEISNMARKYGKVKPEFVGDTITRLIMRGLVGPNPKYDPHIAISMRKKLGRH